MLSLIFLCLGRSESYLYISEKRLDFGVGVEKRELKIGGMGSAKFNWRIDIDMGAQEWLSVEPETGKAEDGIIPVTVTVDPEKADGGTYELKVIATDDEGTIMEAAAVEAEVNVLLHMSEKKLSFGADVEERELEIGGVGGASFDWQIEIIDTSVQEWLSVEPMAGKAEDGITPVTFTVDLEKAREGTYELRVIATDDGYLVEGATVEVTFGIGVSKFSVSPSRLVFGKAGNALAFSIVNEGDVVLDCSIEEAIDWLDAPGPSGNIALNESALVNVTVDRTKLSDPGIYTGSMIVEGGGQTEAVVVTAEK